MHKTIVAAAAVLLTGTGVCLAQPPGITREMIERALPLEGAPKAEPGPYQVTSEPAFGSPGLSRLSPGGAGRVSQEGHLARDGVGQRRVRDRQHALLGLSHHDRLAWLPGGRHGPSGRRSAAAGNADDMRAAIDWAEKENARAGSPLKGKIAVDKVAVMGHVVRRISLDRAGRRSPRQDASACSIPACRKRRPALRRRRNPTADALPKLHGPVLLHQRQRTRLPDGGVGGDVRAINNVPAFYGARHNAGHSATVLSSRRRRVRQCRIELAPVDVQRRQESRQDVRRQELRPLHEFELGREIERDQGMKSPIALAVVAGCAAAVVWAQSPVVVFVSSRQQHAELAESRNQERAREVQESA